MVTSLYFGAILDGSWRGIVWRAAAEDEIGSLGNNRENHAELLFRINVLTFTE